MHNQNYYYVVGTSQIWRLSAILNFIIFFYKSACDRSWNQNLSLHTKFHWNRMIRYWDIPRNYFQNGTVPHLELSQIANLVTWPVPEHDYASTYQISR